MNLGLCGIWVRSNTAVNRSDSAVMNTTSADDRLFIEHGLILSDDQNLEGERFAVADFDGNPHNGLFFALNYSSPSKWYASPCVVLFGMIPFCGVGR